MGRYVFDIILIILAIVVIFHLFYNDVLFTKKCEPPPPEGMASVFWDRQPSAQNATATQLDQLSNGSDMASNASDMASNASDMASNASDMASNASDVASNASKVASSGSIDSATMNTANNTAPVVKVDMDGTPRDYNTKGLDRTDAERKPWYHVANKMESAKTDKKSERLVFGDNYNKFQTSDPYDGGSNSNMRDMAPIKNVEEVMIDASGNKCNPRKDSPERQRYIRDYVLDGKQQCECVADDTQALFTREDVEEYREKQIQFRDKIMGSSAPAEDPVDRLNKITLSGGIKSQGQTVASFYDDLVMPKYQSKLQAPIPSKQCVTNGVFDNSDGVPNIYYTSGANNGKRHVLRDNWMYNGENPNNGGKGVDNIYGDDQDVDYNSMI